MGWVGHLVGWVGSGWTNWTHGQLWSRSSKRFCCFQLKCKRKWKYFVDIPVGSWQLGAPPFNCNKNIDRAQRAKTSAKASNLNQKWSGIRNLIAELIRLRIWTSTESLPKCFVDSLACRRQSFCQVSCKSASDCMRNANNSSKNPLFHNGEGSGKAIRNPYPRPDQHHKLINSSD